jgi:threonyl-tRNA synthetase
VFGEKERRDGLLAVRVRENGKIVKYSAEKLIEEIGRAIAGKPTRPLNLPKMLSQRPIFVGK